MVKTMILESLFQVHTVAVCRGRLLEQASKIYAGDLGANHMAYLDSLRTVL